MHHPDPDPGLPRPGYPRRRRCDRCGLATSAASCPACGHDHDDPAQADDLASERHRLLSLRRDRRARQEWLDSEGHDAFATCPACGQWTRMGLCEWCDFNLSDLTAVAARSAAGGTAEAVADTSSRFMSCPWCHQWSTVPVCIWCGRDATDEMGHVHVVSADERTWRHHRAHAYSYLRALLRVDVVEQVHMVAHLAKWTILGSLVGVLAGLASAFFLVTLEWVTHVREANPWIILILPFAGLAVGAAYHYRGGRSVGGNNLVLDEIHDPQDWVPRRMTVLVYGGTILTQLFGGSAGREGTALQMSGSLTDWASRTLRLDPTDRRIMLIAALSGGFGAVFGVPIAGFVFGLEVQSVGRIEYDALVPALVASLVGDLVVRGLGVHHTVTPDLPVLQLSPGLVLKVAVAGFAFGLAALVFTELTHGIKRIYGARGVWPPMRPFIGGFIIIAMTLAVGDQTYNGLSIPLEVAALTGGIGVVGFAFALKLLFTSVTLGSGFQGGEVTPLFVIGATLGVTMGRLLGVPVEVMAPIGFVAVFAGAANVPLACTVMGVELFGVHGFVLYAVACVVSYVFSSHRGIYTSQRVGVPKAHDVLADPPAAGTRLHEADHRRRQWLPAHAAHDPVRAGKHRSTRRDSGAGG